MIHYRAEVMGQYMALSGQFSRLTESVSPILLHFLPSPLNLPPDPTLGIVCFFYFVE
jgi:hypothetical protein